jgi:hypothetical protein
MANFQQGDRTPSDQIPTAQNQNDKLGVRKELLSRIKRTYFVNYKNITTIYKLQNVQTRFSFALGWKCQIIVKHFLVLDLKICSSISRPIKNYILPRFE